jgi:hypothetical protein
MAERPSKIAKIALSLSIVTGLISIAAAAFSVYQWFDTQRQQRISAAIEFSKDYLHDPEMVDRYAKLLDDDPKKRPMSNEDMLKERSFIDLLNYIAALANVDLIDNRYLSWRIKCDIYYVGRFIVPNRPDIANAMKDITRYVTEHRAADCPDRAPP